jgi:hypothetical protein
LQWGIAVVDRESDTSRLTRVEPLAMRSTMKCDAGCLRIAIPLKGSRRDIEFLSVWLTFWLCGWIFVAGMILFARDQEQQLIRIIWIIFWTMGGIVFFIVLLTMLTGRDIVSIDETHLTVRREIFDFGCHTRHYWLSDVGNLRFRPDEKEYRGSRIAFDYGSKTIEFGDGLDEAEANQLIAAIKQRTRIMGPEPSKSTIPIELQRTPPRPVHFRHSLKFILKLAGVFLVSCVFVLFLGIAKFGWTGS